MAQSHDGSIIDDRDLDISFDRDDLPEGEARLVIHEDGVTTVMQGDAEKVKHRFKQQRADDLDMTVEELDAAIEEYPMPDSDEGLVPAEEFYDDESA
ncbi:hypothetical protein [Halococcus salifodinae]|uniref:Uncharacterized protein n=1 Tax=Halococcus salifodinae DSM 8989 TaxID=1227456 RepID=M0NAP9_9EURY|nr:hypothetical protein [Halococcus salifodinae]EMA53735.1 hypothetical protein C450_07497 [Halococcus salifodinae DSM 8989]